MSSARLELAEAFLREAVYRSRERQAASVALAAPKGKAGTCGLGEKPAVDLDLSPRARQLYAQLWPQGLERSGMERIRGLLEDWVVEQDKLDRKRNHHLKAMRMKHGFVRDEYPAEVAREFEAGLERVNAEESSRRAAVAMSLIGG